MEGHRLYDKKVKVSNRIIGKKKEHLKPAKIDT